MNELILEWLRKADDDFRLAEMALAASPPVAWGAAFHAQQAAEWTHLPDELRGKTESRG